MGNRCGICTRKRLGMAGAADTALVNRDEIVGGTGKRRLLLDKQSTARTKT